MKYSAEERARLLEGWKESGKSVSAYVRERGLTRWTFARWVKADRDSRMSFVEVTAAGKREAPPGAEMLIEKGGVKIHIPLAAAWGGETRRVMEWLGAAE